MNFTELLQATITPHRQALSALTGTGNNENTQGFSLPVQDLGTIAERMNSENPLKAYYSALAVESAGSGSVKIKYPIFNDVWTKKNGWFTETGNGGAGFGYGTDSSTATGKDGVGINLQMIRERGEMHQEFFSWNDSVIKAEGILAADVARGMPETFLSRIDRHLRKFSQNSVKWGFAKLIAPLEKFIAFGKFQKISDHTAPKGTTSTGGPADAAWNYSTDKITVPKAYPAYDVYTPATGTVTLQEKGAVLYKALVDAATNMYIEAQIEPSEITITIDPIQFNLLSMAGLLGDKVSKTFSGGQFQVSTISEFKIQSGGMYMPKIATVAAAHGKGNYLTKAGALHATVTPETADLVAIMGTSDCMIHQKDIIAMNAGRIGNTSDKETYTELTDITAVPDRTFRNKLLKLVVTATSGGTISDPADYVEPVDTETVNIELDSD